MFEPVVYGLNPDTGAANIVAVNSSTLQSDRQWSDGTARYKVVEIAAVTDSEIERVMNETIAGGWSFDSIHFSMWEGSRRPSMAFLMFVQVDQKDAGDRE